MSRLLIVALSLISTESKLPESLEFRRIGAAELRSELRPLLRSSYISTPDDSLRLDYAIADLNWMLDTPDADEALRVGIGVSNQPDGLVAFVCAVPSSLRLHGELHAAVEVSLLCVKRDWRGRGLTKLLLFELRRRAKVAGVHCAVFTEARPKYTLPLLRADCFHRPLQPMALLRCGFWQAPFTPAGDAKTRRRLRAAVRAAAHLPQPAMLSPLAASLPPSSLRRMRQSDAKSCHQMLRDRSSHFAVAPEFTAEQFRHRFLGSGAASFVLAGKQRGEPLLGFASFTILPLRTATGQRLLQAQLLGFALAPSLAAADDALRDAALVTLLDGMLRRARAHGAHVFNALALAELTPALLQQLGFGRGDEASYVCLDAAGGPALSIAKHAPLDPADACWLPVL